MLHIIFKFKITQKRQGTREKNKSFYCIKVINFSKILCLNILQLENWRITNFMLRNNNKFYCIIISETDSSLTFKKNLGSFEFGINSVLIKVLNHFRILYIWILIKTIYFKNVVTKTIFAYLIFVIHPFCPSEPSPSMHIPWRATPYDHIHSMNNNYDDKFYEFNR